MCVCVSLPLHVRKICIDTATEFSFYSLEDLNAFVCLK